MNNIRELDSVLDEEHGDIITDNIPVTLSSIHLDRETTHIADRVRTTLATLDSREAQEQRCLARCISQDAVSGNILRALE